MTSRWRLGTLWVLGMACSAAPASAPPAAQPLPAQPAASSVPPAAAVPPPSVPERRADVAEEAAADGILGEHWRDRHEALLHAPGRSSAQLIVLGDGLVDGWSRSRAFAKQWRERKPLSLALPGDQTQQLLWRIEHGALTGLTPRLVLIGAGRENLAHGFTPSQTARGLGAVLQRVREQLPGSRVLLLGLLPAGKDGNDPLRAASDATNAELRTLANATRVTLADVGSVFLEPDGTFTPGMLDEQGQPTALGYEALTITVSILAQRLLAGS